MSSQVLRQPKQHYNLPHGIEYIDNLSGGTTKLLIAVTQVLWLATGLLIELLAIRFMIAFLGANPANWFFQLIYTSSQPFIAPFANIFGDLVQLGPNRFEAYTLIAISAYAFIGYGLARIMSRHQLNSHQQSH